ncbi:MAG TPA: hypothetical protein PLP29_11455 [Candidatus Ozemobacteraceae bacterium]|nr:hypothetical protein [Candidatus Ozemobacteraceae bacterium]
MDDRELHEAPPRQPTQLESLHLLETSYPWSLIAFLGALGYLFLTTWL